MSTGPRNGSAGCCEQGPVKRRESGTAGLAAQHPQLLPEYQNLEVLGTITKASQDQQAHEHSDKQRQYERHRPRVRSRCSHHESELLRPTRFVIEHMFVAMSSSVIPEASA
jgi:hypothetical protein